MTNELTARSVEAGQGKIQAKTTEFRSVTIGLFLISAAAFTTLYCTQGILPQIAMELGISAGRSQLTVLVGTGCLAVGMFPASLLSERYGRRNIMLASVTLAAIVGMFAPFSGSFAMLLVLKGLQGLFLAGVPAITVAYVSEEFEQDAIPQAIGMYIGGGAFGSLVGRMLPVWVDDATGSWRWALGAATVLTTVFTAVFVLTLPPSRFFKPCGVSYASSARLFVSHLANPRLVLVYLLVFCVMGAYVSMYNGLPFDMESPPINISPDLYSSLFLVNLVGTPAARRAGALAAKIGGKRALLIAMAVLLVGVAPLFSSIPFVIVIGTILVTTGGFAAHACATGLVATTATQGRAQASALYMASFYGGSAVVGLLGSKVFAQVGWNGLLVYMGALVVLGLGLALMIPGKAQVAR